MANHTAQHIAATGGTYYAYPAYSATYTLANWGTHRVELVELASPNEGMYQGTLDDTKGYIWFVFAGASQPADWNEAVAEINLSTSKEAIRDAVGGTWTDEAANSFDLTITDTV